jgi:hypothetical protein
MTISYTHTQSTAALAWSIAHNLNCAPVCDVIENDAGTYRKILPYSVKHIDENNMLVEFTESVAGVARLIGTYKKDVMALPGSIDSGANNTGNAPEQGIGLFADASSSRYIPPLTVSLTDRTFVSNAPGLFEFTDEFTAGPTLAGHEVNTWTPSPTFDVSTPYVWVDPDSDAISGGFAELAINHLGSQVSSTDEYDMPNGIFLETRYQALSQNDTLVIGFNLGYTNISIVAGGTDGGYENHIRMDATGFNGAVNPDGTLLAASPNDAALGLFSSSFTLDRYYSAASGDWRGTVLRLELTPTLLTLYVDGSIVMQQVPRFNVQLFASANFQYSSAFSNVTMFATGAGNGVQVDYVHVGSL